MSDVIPQTEGGGDGMQTENKNSKKKKQGLEIETHIKELSLNKIDKYSRLYNVSESVYLLC
jgi:hypothetical protein